MIYDTIILWMLSLIKWSEVNKVKRIYKINFRCWWELTLNNLLGVHDKHCLEPIMTPLHKIYVGVVWTQSLTVDCRVHIMCACIHTFWIHKGLTIQELHDVCELSHLWSAHHACICVNLLFLKHVSCIWVCLCDISKQSWDIRISIEL